MSEDVPTGFLSKVSLFSSLTPEHLDELTRIAVTRSFPKDTIIFNEGDPADALYIIHKGKLKVQLSNPEGKEATISILGPEDYFGDMALIDDEARCARVVAMSDCEVTLIAKQAFDKFLESEPLIAMALLKSMAKRLRAANRQIGNLAMLDVFGRLARIILDLSAEVDGEIVVPDLPPENELASMAGASREMVNTAMNELLESGYVRMRGKELVVRGGLGVAAASYV